MALFSLYLQWLFVNLPRVCYEGLSSKWFLFVNCVDVYIIMVNWNKKKELTGNTPRVMWILHKTDQVVVALRMFKGSGKQVTVHWAWFRQWRWHVLSTQIIRNTSTCRYLNVGMENSIRSDRTAFALVRCCLHDLHSESIIHQFLSAHLNVSAEGLHQEVCCLIRYMHGNIDFTYAKRERLYSLNNYITVINSVHKISPRFTDVWSEGLCVCLCG